jgi:Flp pilus assembly protein TadD
MDDADIAYNRGICLSEMGRFEACIEPLERCLRIDPSYGNARVGLGVALMRLRRSEEAEQVLRQALAAEPQNHFAARNLAAVLANRVGDCATRPVRACRQRSRQTLSSEDAVGRVLGS